MPLISYHRELCRFELCYIIFVSNGSILILLKKKNLVSNLNQLLFDE